MTTITHRTGTYGTETHEQHIYEIHDEHGTAAELYIDPTYLVIANIEVRADRRGEGLARALYEHADEHLGGIYHMPDWGCTPEGHGFAAAVGGDTLDNETAAEYAGIDLEALGLAA